MKIAIIVLMIISCSIEAQQKLELIYIDNLVEQEIGQEIFQEIYSRMGIRVRMIPVPAIRAEKLTASAQMDGEVMRIYQYGNENPYLIRVPTSYYNVETMAFVREDSRININSPEDLKDYTIVRVRGIKHTRNVSKNAKEIYEISSSNELLKFVQLGRSQVALTSFIEGKVLLERNDSEGVIPMDSPLERLKLYHYLHKRHSELVPILDNFLKELKSNGELAKIIRRAENTVLLRDN